MRGIWSGVLAGANFFEIQGIFFVFVMGAIENLICPRADVGIDLSGMTRMSRGMGVGKGLPITSGARMSIPLAEGRT
jgi:hypothetical protein